MTRPLLAALGLFTACSGHGAPTRPTPPPSDAPRGAVVAEPGPTEAECDALIDHAIDLSSGEAGVSSADRAQLRIAVRDHVLARCRAMPRAVYRCAEAATTVDAFTRCDPT